LPDIITINQLFYLVITASPALTTTLLRRRSMKLVKNFVFTVLLGSVLAVSTFGGEQSTPGFAAPTPTPTPAEGVLILDDGTVLCDPNDGNTETSDYLFFEALAALLSVY
jgi:hypothetical protein